jgi:hypothetical protein
VLRSNRSTKINTFQHPELTGWQKSLTPDQTEQITNDTGRIHFYCHHCFVDDHRIFNRECAALEKAGTLSQGKH